jgi:DNA-directed RNA polymerase subunit RPC12/RpoP
MANGEKRDKGGLPDFVDFLLGNSEEEPPETTEDPEKPKPPQPRASLQTVGLIDCSICGREVSVMLTKANHPFTACGWCGGRTFYNSRIAIGILKDRLREIDHE